MESIDLRKIKTVFICPDHNEKYKERCVYIFELLRTLGFEHVAHYKSGSSEPHEPYPLNRATYNILQMHMNEPVLIVEDDLEFVPNPQMVFEIPPGTDAMYFGISGADFNFEKQINGGHAKFEIINSKYARILNMLSAHAILYISPTYKSFISSALRYTDTANDIEICKHQSNFNLIALRKPICWQSARFNNPWIEYITKIQIADNGYTDDLVVGEGR
jgi:hypothetical protein